MWGPIHAPVPRSESPQERPTTYGGRRQRREQQKALRRLLVALPILIGLLTGPLLFALSMERQPVARLEVPTVGPGPEATSEAASGATHVETELTEEKTEPLRSELNQIA
jgi:hypothetical protein